MKSFKQFALVLCTLCTVSAFAQEQDYEIGTPDKAGSATFHGKDGSGVFIGPVPSEYVSRDYPVPTNPYDNGGVGVEPYGICIKRPDSDPHRRTMAQELWLIPFFAGFSLAISDYDRWMDGDFEFWCRTVSVRHGRYTKNQGANFWVGDDDDSGGLYMTARSAPGKQYAEIASTKWRPANGFSQGDFRLRLAGYSDNNPNSFLFTTGPTSDSSVVIGRLEGATGDLSVAGTIATSGGANKWELLNLTVDDGVTNVHAVVNGVRVKWPVTVEQGGE